jgi:hypothetical protein
MNDFTLSANGPVSHAFREKGITAFLQACEYIRSLPYKRNTDKENLLSVLSDGFGTCSTKHALLHLLAAENGHDEVSLVLVLFKMNAANTPAVAATLHAYELPYIPEAHNYLSANGQRFDYTGEGFNPQKIAQSMLQETAITPKQITGFKVQYHRAFLQGWLVEHPEIKWSLEELWKIREQCITDLAAE